MDGDKPYDYSDAYFRKDNALKHTDVPISNTVKDIITQEKTLNSTPEDLLSLSKGSDQLLRQYYIDEEYKNSLEGAKEINQRGQETELTLYICDDGFYRSRDAAVDKKGTYLKGGAYSRLGYQPKDILLDVSSWVGQVNRIEFENKANDAYSLRVLEYLDGVISIFVRGSKVSESNREMVAVPEELRERLSSTECGRFILSLCAILPSDTISLIPLEEDVLLVPKEPAKMGEVPPNSNVYFLSMNNGIFAVNPSIMDEKDSLSQPYCLMDIINQYIGKIKEGSSVPGSKWEPRNTTYGNVVMMANSVLESTDISFEEKTERDKFLNILITKYITLKNQKKV